MSRRTNKKTRRPDPSRPASRPPAASAAPAAVDERTEDTHAYATDLVEAARVEAQQHLDQAHIAAQEILEAARETAAGLRQEADDAASKARGTLESARTEAERLLARAQEQASALQTKAREHAERVVTEAQARADNLLAAAQRAGKETEEATRRAQVLAQELHEDADRVLAAAKDTAERARRRAEEETQQLRTRAEEDVDAALRRARAEAERLTVTARQEAAREVEAAADERRRADADAKRILADAEQNAARLRSQAEDILVQARERKQVAEQALQAADNKRTEAEERWNKAMSRTERRLAKRRLQQDAKDARRARRRELRAARPTLGSRLARLGAWTRTLARHQARRVLVGGPIIAPMAVAWWSQTDYARTAFGWWTVFALGFAAAWELTTAFTGWMYHQARKQGDSGALYRVMTWVFAAGAAAMNYAHHCGPGGKPTQPAVAFATMSVVGMVLWELYALLVHREYLREQGLLSRPRPRVGFIRWFRYPIQSWTAWSLMITDSSLTTLDRAWSAAGAVLKTRSEDRAVRSADRTAVKAGLTLHRVVIPRVHVADRGPASIPTMVLPALTTGRTAGPDRTVKSDRTAGPDRTVKSDRTAGPDRTVKSDRTAGPDRTVKSDRTAGPDRTVKSDRTAGVVLKPEEETAVETLRAKKKSLSKSNLATAVRDAGGTISTERALLLAAALKQSPPSGR